MYKRPRMDDPYGGPPMMGYGDMYGGPMGMGAMGGDMFPCCKLRGLPFDVSDHDIKMFLGFEPLDIVLLRRDGRLSGEAFVVVGNLQYVEMTLAKNKCYLGRRYVEVYKAKKMDYYRAVCQEVMEGGGAPRPYGGRGGDFEGGGGYGGGGFPAAAAGAAGAAAGEGTEGTTILKLRGLPFAVTDDDICTWFNEDTSLGITPVVKDNVLIVMDNGRPSGVAFVEFPSPQEATSALAKNKQMMGSRYVEMFPANRADLERYKARGGF